MSALPETVLQFGAGRFLRGFVDRFIHQANEDGAAVGRVVVVQTTGGARADSLGSRPEGFPVLVRGMVDDAVVERIDWVGSISRALQADRDWQAVMAVATSPDLQLLVSNATEAGYQLFAEDKLSDTPAKSLAGKLVQVLLARFEKGLAPLVILPCELIEGNADRLRELAVQQAQRWGLSQEFVAWLTQKNTWLNNLVDCMITSAPENHPMAKEHPLLIHAEPYTLWAIRRPAGFEPPAKLQGLFRHQAVKLVDDLSPFYLRKVRILNGLHSAMVAKFLPQGFVTVQDVLKDKKAVRWVRDLLFDEIVPAIAARVGGAAEFADQTYDRLRNPFLQHKLSDIRLNHAEKIKVRLQPTYDEYQKLFGAKPSHLAEALAVEFS